MHQTPHFLVIAKLGSCLKIFTVTVAFEMKVLICYISGKFLVKASDNASGLFGLRRLSMSFEKIFFDVSKPFEPRVHTFKIPKLYLFNFEINFKIPKLCLFNF